MSEQPNSYPDSPYERPYPPRRVRDPRLRTAALLASLSGWLFVLSVVLFLISNYRLLLPDSLRRLGGYLSSGLQSGITDTATIRYTSGSLNDAVLFSDGLAYVDSDTLYISKPNGLNPLSMQLPFANPRVESSDSLVLAYDRGGKQALLANAIAPVCEVSLDSPIITGTIGRTGGFAIVTDESGYKTAVTVYNDKGKQVFKWFSSEYYILTAALSPDGSHLATLAFRQNDVELESQVLIWRIGHMTDPDPTPEASYSLGNAMGYALRFQDSQLIAVMTDHGASIIDRRGELIGSYEVTPSDLLAYSFCGRGVLLISNAYQGAARAAVRLLDHGGQVSEEPLLLYSELQHLAAEGDRLGVLTTDGLAVFDVSAWELRWSDETITGARGLRMDAMGAAYILYGSECRILTE